MAPPRPHRAARAVPAEHGEFSDAHVAETQAAADAVAKEMRAACLGMVTRPPLAVFDGVYAEPHTGLERQRDEYAAYLATFEVEA